jgi:hypothetical protein
MSKASPQQPAPPFPAQSQPKPGKESELRPRPRYEAPLYRARASCKGRWP